MPRTADSADTRAEQIAVLNDEHARLVERAVDRRVGTTAATVEDACAFAWMQLLTHGAIDLGPPPWRALSWLIRTAVHEAWRLEAKQAHEERLRREAVQRVRATHQHAGGADEAADQRARMALVVEIPERPRRFLMRLALGHSYREIAAAENVSVTTVTKQIARAKRLVRELDRDDQQAA